MEYLDENNGEKLASDEETVEIDPTRGDTRKLPVVQEEFEELDVEEGEQVVNDLVKKERSIVVKSLERALDIAFDPVAEYLAKKGWDPCEVTSLGIPIHAAAMVMHQFSPPAAVVIFAGASLLDAVDGKLARLTKRTTEEGAIYDALVDKIITLAWFTYLTDPILQLDSEKLEVLIKFLEEFGVSGVEGDHIKMLLLSFMAGISLSAIVLQLLRASIRKNIEIVIQAIRDPRIFEYKEKKLGVMSNDDGKTKLWFERFGQGAMMASLTSVPIMMVALMSLLGAAVFNVKSGLGKLWNRGEEVNTSDKNPADSLPDQKPDSDDHC